MLKQVDNLRMAMDRMEAGTLVDDLPHYITDGLSADMMNTLKLTEQLQTTNTEVIASALCGLTDLDKAKGIDAMVKALAIIATKTPAQATYAQVCNLILVVVSTLRMKALPPVPEESWPKGLLELARAVLRYVEEEC